MKKIVNWSIGVLGIALVATILLVVFYSGPEEYTYEGPGGTYEFIYAKSKSAEVYFNYMLVNVGDDSFTVPLRSSPYDVENIPLDLRTRDEILVHGFDERWFKTRVLFTQEPELANLTDQGSVYAVNQVGLVVDQKGLFGLELEQGFTSIPSWDLGYDEDSLITCDRAKSTHSVIEIRWGEPGIFVERDNCVVLQANSKENMVLVGDLLVMHLVGVF
tara:strand:- start:2755 stop:3405 length:651 start_codon:yes stop_codon:yes gene_type:complete